MACPPVVLCTFDGNDCVVCAAKNADGSSLLVVLDKLVSNGVVLLLAELELAFDRVFFVRNDLYCTNTNRYMATGTNGMMRDR